MPFSHDQHDLSNLLNRAFSAVAERARSNGICVCLHTDARLPRRVRCNAMDLERFLVTALTRTIDTAGSQQIGLALWLDEGDAEAGTDPRIVLEVSRGLADGGRNRISLAELWAVPFGADVVQPVSRPSSPNIEAASIPLPFAALETSTRFALKWGEVFRGRRVLRLGEPLFDPERHMKSLAALGVDAKFVQSPTEAVEAARTDAKAGNPFDFLVLDHPPFDDCLDDDAMIALVRRFRSNPLLSDVQIIPASDIIRDPEVEEAETKAIFNADPEMVLPWRRLLGVCHFPTVHPVDPATRSQRAESQPSGTPGTIAKGLPVLDGYRILIAEDVATNQVLLQAVLAPTGAEVEVVEDGAVVLERHVENPADLILMDLNMPGMGGIAAIRRIRELEGKARKVCVVALTAYASNADRRRALEAGMDAYLAKPILLDEFFDLLHALLPNKTAQRGR